PMCVVLCELLLVVCPGLVVHSKCIECLVVSQLCWLRNPPRQPFQIGPMSQQHCAERRLGLSIGMALRVRNLLEPRLRNVVTIPEVDKVLRATISLPCAAQRQDVSVEGVMLNPV